MIEPIQSLPGGQGSELAANMQALALTHVCMRCSNVRLRYLMQAELVCIKSQSTTSIEAICTKVLGLQSHLKSNQTLVKAEVHLPLLRKSLARRRGQAATHPGMRMNLILGVQEVVIPNITNGI